MKFNLSCQLNYSIAQTSTLVFNIGAIDNEYQSILQENLQIDPNLVFDEYTEPDTKNRYFRLNAPSGKLQVSYQATVELSHFYTDPDAVPEVPPAELPLNTLRYLYPSRYCQADKLMRLAQHEFGNLKPGYSRVTAICNWIYDNVAYLSFSSNQNTSAYDTATERVGVCRDFAHLGIAFCRALNIPARFISGYAYGLNPPDFHACFEAYLGDRWYLFDPSRLVPQTGIIRIGTGRDAADVSFATIFGSVQMEQMRLFVEPVQAPDITSQEKPAYTVEAIATA
jgi:transglutaminase-like putative cysteine protease